MHPRLKKNIYVRAENLIAPIDLLIQPINKDKYISAAVLHELRANDGVSNGHPRRSANIANLVTDVGPDLAARCNNGFVVMNATRSMHGNVARKSQ